MEKAKINHRKKMARYRYQELIYEMYLNKKSIGSITKNINFRLSKTALKVKLSETLIRNIVKEFQEKRKKIDY